MCKYGLWIFGYLHTPVINFYFFDFLCYVRLIMCSIYIEEYATRVDSRLLRLLCTFFEKLNSLIKRLDNR
jgi:hypothetical protein